MTPLPKIPLPPPPLPSPGQAFRFLDQRAPVSLKQILVEPLLNRLFAEGIREGEFEELEGRTVRLEVTDLDGGGITLGFWLNRLRLVEAPGQVVIRGDWRAFRDLAEGRQDPDTLFFRRRLSIEGDTELGLAVKNLLDGIEWG